MENTEIRNEAKRMNVRHWQIADYIGISESTFVHWMRRELQPDRKKMVLDAINAISANREAG